MPVELSTTITRLLKDAASAAHSGQVHAVHVADLVAPRLAPLVPEGEPVPDLVAFQLTLARLVEAEREQLLEIDATHVAELTDARENRRLRDAAFDDLYDQLSAIQEAWNGVYVSGGSTLFDGVELLPQDPVVLHRLGERVHRRLASAEFVEPEARLAGQSLNREALATELATRVDRLGTALSGVSVELKTADETLFAKQRAIDGCRRTLRFVASCLAGLYGLAGLDDLAAKVLPKRRAPRRSTTEDGGPADGTPDGPVTPPEGGPDPAAGDETGDGAPSAPPLSGPLGIVS
jgi:hypothetical protein